MEKVYIAKYSIYDEDGDLLYMPNDILDRDYGEELCYETDMSQLGELVGIVNDMLQELSQLWNFAEGIDPTVENVAGIMYDITTRQG